MYGIRWWRKSRDERIMKDIERVKNEKDGLFDWLYIFCFAEVLSLEWETKTNKLVRAFFFFYCLNIYIFTETEYLYLFSYFVVQLMLELKFGMFLETKMLVTFWRNKNSLGNQSIKHSLQILSNSFNIIINNSFDIILILCAELKIYHATLTALTLWQPCHHRDEIQANLYFTI